MSELISIFIADTPAGVDWSVIRYLQQREACTPEAAVAYVPPRHLERRRLGLLQRRGVVVETPAGLYYLNAPKLERVAEKQRRLVLILCAIVGAIALAVLLAALFGAI